MDYFIDRTETLNPNFKKTKLGTTLEKNLKEVKRITTKPVDTPIDISVVKQVRTLAREVNQLIANGEE